MESMYFGDEDPMLVTPCYKKSVPTDPRVKVKQQDLVLLFDDSSNSFSFSDGGGVADIYSPNIVSPMAAVAQQKVLPIVYKHTISAVVQTNATV